MLEGDARAAATYFSPAGAILTADGTAVSGRDRVAQVLVQITGAAQELRIGVGQTVVCDEVALCTQFWRRSSDGPGASSYRGSSTARLVLRRGRRWEIVIASPWG
jgi:hypothetical protein